MRPKWPNVASQAQETCTLYTFNSLLYYLLPKDDILKNILSNIGLVARKPIFGVSDKASFKPGPSATETSYIIEISPVAS